MHFPGQLDYKAKDLIRRLLKPEMERLGNLSGGVNDIKNHAWFIGVDWNTISQKMFRPPIQPIARTPGDTSNFTTYAEESTSLSNPVTIPMEYQLLFKDF
jgi:hypothetical protein